MKLKLNHIYEQDCIDFIEKLRVPTFDIIVTSPPYNINKEYTTYKDNRDREIYLEWMRHVAEASFRILKEGGSFFLNVGGKPSDPKLPLDVAMEFAQVFVLQNVIHWIKHISIPRGTDNKAVDLNGDVAVGHFKPINSDLYLNQAHEYIFHFSKDGRTALDKRAIGVPYKDKSNINRWGGKQDIRDRGNVWFIPYDTKVGAYRNPMLHPAEFPVKLPYLCIKLHGVTPDILVYDPFMGIGSTAVACTKLGVSFVGTEIDKNYISIAEQRLKDSAMELHKRARQTKIETE